MTSHICSEVLTCRMRASRLRTPAICAAPGACPAAATPAPHCDRIDTSAAKLRSDQHLVRMAVLLSLDRAGRLTAGRRAADLPRPRAAGRRPTRNAEKMAYSRQNGRSVDSACRAGDMRYGANGASAATPRHNQLRGAQLDAYVRTSDRRSRHSDQRTNATRSLRP